MLFRKFRIEYYERKLQKRFIRLCRNTKYLTGKTTDDILFELRCVGIILEDMMTKGESIDGDYLKIIKDLSKSRTLQEMINKIKLYSGADLEDKTLQSKLDDLYRKFNSTNDEDGASG